MPITATVPFVRVNNRVRREMRHNGRLAQYRGEGRMWYCRGIYMTEPDKNAWITSAVSMIDRSQRENDCRPAYDESTLGPSPAVQSAPVQVIQTVTQNPYQGQTSGQESNVGSTKNPDFASFFEAFLPYLQTQQPQIVVQPSTSVTTPPPTTTITDTTVTTTPGMSPFAGVTTFVQNNKNWIALAVLGLAGWYMWKRKKRKGLLGRKRRR